MEVSARAKNLSLSVKDLRRLALPIRGRRVEEALTMLRFSPSPWSRQVAKVVRSAAANAENNYQMDPSTLRIVRVDLGPGVTLKRMFPRARGQAGPIHRLSSHLTIVVDEEAAAHGS
ncbi:MAG: 50S ribosomal protein L22 [Chloroflexi bacterium]|nr:50S ribosomal protein L22 [Chloroflexota bacterium]